MNIGRQFSILGHKQIAVQEGIELLRQARLELENSSRTVEAWSMVGVLGSLALIPLNCIVNSFQLKTVSSLYQIFVRQIYGQFGKSGTRLDGHVKTVLSLLKQAIAEELKRKALVDYIPGVNILVGLAEDSVAAWQVFQVADAGSRELEILLANLNRKIDAATQQLVKLGIERNEALEKIQNFSRTA